MRTPYFKENWLDQNNNPTGGVAYGTGFTISWQNGPLGRDENRKEPNGAFVENILDAVIQRIEFYQANKFSCAENEIALIYLRLAAKQLDNRTKDRELRRVEGTHKE